MEQEKKSFLDMYLENSPDDNESYEVGIVVCGIICVLFMVGVLSLVILF